MKQQVILGIMLVAGFLLVYSDAFVRPSHRAAQAVAKVKNYSLGNRYNRIIQGCGDRIKPLVRLTDYRRGEYVRMLDVLGIRITPEDYTARTLVKAALFFALGLLFGFAAWPLLILGPVFAIIIYIYEYRTLKGKYEQRKTEIELELPELCSVINARLQSTSIVAEILSDFLPIASPAMTAELTVTLSDMNTGNVETALRRFEGRISSPKVSDVVRGLIAVQNGDDMRVFFQSKQYQFNNDYITMKKKSVMQRPMKLGLPGMLAFLFFMMIIMYPMMVGMQKMLSDFM